MGDVRLMIEVLLGGGWVGGLIMWFLRDRRKGNAETAVAERTVTAQVRKVDTSSLEAHVALMAQAFEEERESKDRQIGELKTELGEVKAKIAERDATIAERDATITELRSDLSAVHGRLDEVLRRVNLMDGADE